MDDPFGPRSANVTGLEPGNSAVSYLSAGAMFVNAQLKVVFYFQIPPSFYSFVTAWPSFADRMAVAQFYK
jgi:hypothetical protein